MNQEVNYGILKKIVMINKYCLEALYSGSFSQTKIIDKKRQRNNVNYYCYENENTIFGAATKLTL